MWSTDGAEWWARGGRAEARWSESNGWWACGAHTEARRSARWLAEANDGQDVFMCVLQTPLSGKVQGVAVPWS